MRMELVYILLDYKQWRLLVNRSTVPRGVATQKLSDNNHCKNDRLALEASGTTLHPNDPLCLAYASAHGSALG